MTVQKQSYMSHIRASDLSPTFQTVVDELQMQLPPRWGVFYLTKGYAMNQDKRDKALTEPVMDTANAAAYLDMKPGTLEIWRSTKREGPPYIKVGRSVKYRRSDLDAWLDRRTHKATQAA